MEYLTTIGSTDLVMENGIQLKNPGAQKILEKFSQHYGILKIFQERVHEKNFKKIFQKNQSFELGLLVDQFQNLIRMQCYMFFCDIN